jgi:hypothetical protein
VENSAHLLGLDPGLQNDEKSPFQQMRKRNQDQFPPNNKSRTKDYL